MATPIVAGLPNTGVRAPTPPNFLQIQGLIANYPVSQADIGDEVLERSTGNIYKLSLDPGTGRAWVLMNSSSGAVVSTVGGQFGPNPTALSSSVILAAGKNQNAATIGTISNTTAGTSSSAQLNVNSDSAVAVVLAGATTNSIGRLQNRVEFGTNTAAAGVNIAATGTGGDVRFYVNGSTLAGTFGSTTDLTVQGNVILNGNATMLRVQGGAVTDFIGTSTLVAGTVTIANTNIASGDMIFFSITAVNSSTALGVYSYTISNGASFTVTSRQPGTPGSTQTGDLSSFNYFIVRMI